MTDAPLDLRALAHGMAFNCAVGKSHYPYPAKEHSSHCNAIHAALVRVHADGWRGGTKAQQESYRKALGAHVDGGWGEAWNKYVDTVNNAPLVSPPEKT